MKNSIHNVLDFPSLKKRNERKLFLQIISSENTGNVPEEGGRGLRWREMEQERFSLAKKSELSLRREHQEKLCRYLPLFSPLDSS